MRPANAITFQMAAVDAGRGLRPEAEEVYHTLTDGCPAEAASVAAGIFGTHDVQDLQRHP